MPEMVWGWVHRNSQGPGRKADSASFARTTSFDVAPPFSKHLTHKMLKCHPFTSRTGQAGGWTMRLSVRPPV